MHILILALSRFDRPSGICRYAANLAKCLDEIEQISRITLVLGSWQEKYFLEDFQIDSEKIKIYPVNIKNSSIYRNIWFISQLPKLTKILNADLVHVSFPIPFFRFIFPCPVVATIHDFYPFDNPENFGFPNYIFNQLFTQICVKNADGITCVSQVTLSRLKYYFPQIYQQKLPTVIYNYVDFQNTQSQSPNIIENTPFILAVAQHRKNKNLDLLVQAYGLLIQNLQIDSITKLIIVGSEGPETQRLLQLVNNLSLEKSVIFSSSLSDPELCWLYQNCELFVCPSASEGFCLPLVEALYFSCQIVCSDIPILKEVGNSDCIYFSLEGEVVKNLSTAIIDAYNQHKIKSKTNDLRFAKANIADQYLDFYRKFITGKFD
ncbi:MAG: glycosyltransferase family 4 protein [Okeania sp. SIO2F4]|uniref:glycosyltransferase family 4 protein n=1 Tax=Okeania sp. SIO2F4 TaxID=2607790 RepID=UPI001428EE2C|nr:glycosyltransferase family 1 protein [Okeania sp. SIO2F4]NES06110.1 glycosyltransferase family 4 protein [Okeania sp. SIO2F4]